MSVCRKLDLLARLSRSHTSSTSTGSAASAGVSISLCRALAKAEGA
jgi:hypothetical protein